MTDVGVCGQGIMKCKCRTVNWKYVTVGVEMWFVWSGDTEM